MTIYKRISSFILSLLLVFSILGSTFAIQIFAVTSPALSAESKTVNAGERFTIAVSLANATSVYGGNFTLQYDSDLLSIDTNSFEFGSIVSDHIKNCNTNYQSAGNLIRVTFSGASAVSSNGTLVTFTFTAKVSGTASLQFNSHKMYDENGTSINTAVTNGTVEVQPKPTPPVKELVSVEISSNPTKTSYEINESFDTSGLALKLTYSDNSTEIITNGFEVSGFSSATAGTKTIIVSYHGFTDAFSVVIKSNEIITDIYYIYTVDDLIAINDDLSGNYILMNDLDLSLFENWNPIGEELKYSYKSQQHFEDENKTYFTGTFNGNGHTINNLTCNTTITDTSTNPPAFGLFSHISGADIRNLNFANINVNISFSDQALEQTYRIAFGSVTAGMYNSTIENCNVINGNINAPQTYSAGLVGVNLDGSVISNCTNYANGSFYAGIIARSYKLMNIIDCINDGNIINATGGILGGFQANVYRCYNYGNITSSSLAGGIVAVLYGKISECANYGNITCLAYEGMVTNRIGGIVASFDGNNAISKCINYGKILSAPSIDNEGFVATEAGGIVGELASGTMSECQNYGNITIDCINIKNTGGFYASGILGYTGDYNCEWFSGFNLINYGDIEVINTDYSYNSIQLQGITDYANILNNVANYGDFYINNCNAYNICLSGITTKSNKLYGAINKGNIEISGDISNFISGGISANFAGQCIINNVCNIGSITLTDNTISENDRIYLGGLAATFVGKVIDTCIETKNLYYSGNINLNRNNLAAGDINIGTLFAKNNSTAYIKAENIYTTLNYTLGSGDIGLDDKIILIDDLSNKNSFAGFDFSETWTLENGQYPTLINSKFEDDTIPTILYDATNNYTSSQNITLKAFDNIGITEYYWGTSPIPQNYTSIITTNKFIIEKTIPNYGTYYFYVKDINDNISCCEITFFKINLNANGGSVSPTYIITKEGYSILLPTPTKNNTKFMGWDTSSSSINGVKTITPTSNKTYYAIWDEASVIANGTCGDNIKWEIDSKGTLKITGSGVTKNYGTQQSVPWYSYASQIKKIEIAETITKIGHYSFYCLTNLESVTTDNVDLSFGYYVFNGKTTFYAKGAGTLEEFVKIEGHTLVKPENPETVLNPELVEATMDSITLKALTGYEYSMDGIVWQDSNIFTNLFADTEYVFYQRIKEGAYKVSATSEEARFSTLDQIAKPTIEKIENNTVNLAAKDGYEYSVDGSTWQSNNVFTNLDFDKILTFYQRITGDTENISEAAECLIPSAPVVQLIGATKIVVKAIDGYEYSLDGEYWQSSNIFTMLVPEFEYVVYQRYSGSDVYTVTSAETAFITNGQDEVDTTPDSTSLVTLRKALLNDFNDMSLDYNADGEVNIIDLVRLKKFLVGIDVPLGSQNTETQTVELLSQPAYLEQKNTII